MSLPLTADLCARAFIASAATFGDDPERALLLVPARGDKRRRSIAPAVLAIVHTTGCHRLRFCLSVKAPYSQLAVALDSPAAKAAYEAAKAAILTGRVGTVVAPPPVALKAPLAAPAKPVAPKPPAAPKAAVTPPPPSVDHRDAIKAAMERRRAAATLSSPDTCAWPKVNSGMIEEDPCTERAVQGRLYCPTHCRRLGQKDTPVQLGVADMPARYTDRAAG